MGVLPNLFAITNEVYTSVGLLHATTGNYIAVGTVNQAASYRPLDTETHFRLEPFLEDAELPRGSQKPFLKLYKNNLSAVLDY